MPQQRPTTPPARPHRRSLALRALIGCSLLLAGSSGGVAQELPPADLRLAARGVVLPEVAPPADPSQTWALYLPTAFTAERRWPLLVIFDPRGAGARAADLFRPAAEEFGWIVAASNRTRSDGGSPAENQRAINSLLGDVTTRLPIDPQRMYAAGFSGGAVLAWAVGVLGGELAGVIAVGGRPAPEHAARRPTFPLFAAAGSEDFNYLPTLDLVEHAAAAGVPTRFEEFAGPHAWCPPEVARRAVAWMELQSTAARAQLSPERLAALFAEEVAAADRKLTAGDRLAALRAWREIADAFRFAPAMAAQVAELERRAADLAAQPETSAAEKAERTAIKAERQAQVRLGQAIGLLQAELPPTAARVENVLGLADLHRRSADSGPRGAAARRALATAHVNLSFYLGLTWLQAGELDRALPALTAATAIRPDDPVSWYNLACVRARLGRNADAIEALERSLEAGLPQPDKLRTDSDLDSLRPLPAFAALLERIDPAGG